MGAYELNRPPVASAISMGCALGQAVSLQVIGAPKHAPVDADGDSMTVTAAGAADSGISGFTATSVTYNANGTPGTHSFSYTVTDALGATDTKTVTVSVSAAEGFNKLSGPTPLGGGLYQLGYLGIPGEKYALDETSSLTPPITWTPVITNTASGLGAIGFTFTPVNPSGYFRTRYVP